ncbi:MAG: tail fiber domain-containing protein [Limisphaerales bacterium]
MIRIRNPKLETRNGNSAHRWAGRAFCILHFAFCLSVAAQGTSFTYQGRLDTNGVPLNGTVTLRPTLWDASSGGTLVAGNSPTDFLATLTNGLFTATLNFGGAAFNGQPRWLQWEVSHGGGPFTTLAPRQPVTPAPYAMIAGNVSGVIANSSLPASPSFSGTVAALGFAGGGAGLTGLNASELTSGTVPAAALANAWKITGNSSTTPGTHFVGTTDNQALEIKVNNQRALRVQPNATAPNLIGGFGGNVITGGSSGSSISGGGAVSFTNLISAASYATIGGGRNNQIRDGASDSFIGGGANHQIEGALRAAIVGGNDNWIQANSDWALIGSGSQNVIQSNSYGAAVVGGAENQIGPDGGASIIGGGKLNQIQRGSQHDVLVGGFLNLIGTNASYNSLVGGYQNSIANNISDAVLGGGRFNSINSQSVFIGGGQQNSVGANSPYAAIVAGKQNAVGQDADQSFIGGGQFNFISYGTFTSLIAGGYGNTVDHDAESAVIGGGRQNVIAANGDFATIPGGWFNTATNFAFAAGRRAKALHTGAFVWADSTDADFNSTTANQFNIRATGGVRFVTDGAGMTLDGQPLASGTNFARLSASQTFTGTNLFTERVGIGVTSPLRSLHVRDISGGLGGDIQVGSTSADGTSKLVHFGDAHASGRGYVAIGETGADDRMELTAGTFVFTNLSQSGRVGIGRLPTANKLEVEGDASKTTAGSWLANSDARIKQDIQPITGALEKLDRVRLVSFRYTDAYRAAHPSATDRRYLNVVAQEFREVFPDHVKSSGEKLPDGSEILQVDTYPLTIYTAAAVQELRAENAALKARLEKLEQLLSQQLNPKTP